MSFFIGMVIIMGWLKKSVYECIEKEYINNGLVKWMILIDIRIG